MSPTGRSETILVVDDDRMVLGLADSMLTRYGYTVVTANSGEEALRLFENIQVDLALVDVVMHDMNGVGVVERIHELHPALPILFFSGYYEHESLRPMFARGIPFLAKPFTSLQLTQKIREALDTPKVNAAESA